MSLRMPYHAVWIDWIWTSVCVLSMCRTRFRSLRSVSLFVSICSIIAVRSSLFLFPGGLERSNYWITDDDDQALAYFKQTVNQTGLREQDLAFALAEFHTGNGAKRNLDHAIDNLSKLHQI